MNIVSRIVRHFLPPIEVGQKWVLADEKGDPWSKWVYEVEDIKNGFVLYRATVPRDGYRAFECQSCSRSSFRVCFTLLK